MPSMEKPFSILCDASSQGLGCVLMQDGPVVAYERSWNKNLPYVEFSYNNSYQESLKMTPFAMLYGRRCRTPLFWNKTRERKVFGPDILQGAEIQVCMVRENLKIALSR
jgi:hypothetical protein